MKKWVRWFCASLIALVSVFIVSCTGSRHKYERENTENLLTEDSVWFENMSTVVNNPQFSDGISVYKYQKKEGLKRHQDSIFFSMPKEVLLNVSQVLVNRKIELTKHNIVEEFESGKDIYLNLDKVDRTRHLDPPLCEEDTLDGSNN